MPHRRASPRVPEAGETAFLSRQLRLRQRRARAQDEAAVALGYGGTQDQPLRPILHEKVRIGCRRRSGSAGTPQMSSAASLWWTWNSLFVFNLLEDLIDCQ